MLEWCFSGKARLRGNGAPGHLTAGCSPHQDYPVLLPVESGTGRPAGCVLGPETCFSQGLGHCPEGRLTMEEEQGEFKYSSHQQWEWGNDPLTPSACFWDNGTFAIWLSGDAGHRMKR